ncbi:MAG TPA: low molecular weight protein-tyrosine-phosphatase [Variovorax sp.]|nr:low molecular weight protein-tyrosine-phosphatase [Variovorax sp.]
MQNILVLCIGNICRSPLAEVLLAREFPDKTIRSAGLGALVGEPADPLSVALALEQGLDLSMHRAQQVNSLMCQRAELILVMEDDHRFALEQRYPFVQGRVFRLADRDIADPFRLKRRAFEAAYADIARGVTDWAARIRQLG